jgi:hypothetical protein
MNIAQIEENLQKIVKSFQKESFIYDLLSAYGKTNVTIKRLQGSLNLSKVEGEILWKKNLFYKIETNQNIHVLLEELKADPKAKKNSPRFLILTDFKTLVAFDTKTTDSLDIPILEIPKHFDFFLPLAGMEKAQHQNENPADVKAAEKMAKLYDEIKKDNPTKTETEVHNLNVFLSRLLFCFFAEDTGIFEKGQFTIGIGSHTQQDGSDLNTYLDNLFKVMNTEHSNRKKLPAYLEAFDYVNGGLFRKEHHAPIFTRRSRQTIIDSGELDWSAINPDIFGSMIQAVITPEHRGGLGMHYTSVPNIMKVIEPLFLNELYEEFEAAKGNNKKLNALLHRIWKIKIFDPACGSGNFLIIAYKELRKLEMKIFKCVGSIAFSNINLGNFYGIELDDFAHEIAILSLWLAEHQMNQEFSKEFGRTKPALPLKETGNIVHGNATRLDWEIVCPKKEGDEIFLLGNPPYLGGKTQSKEQKKDMELSFNGEKKIGELDYISCWFIKGSSFLSEKACFAFVTTNSICQGSQVQQLWPHIFKNDCEIHFAYKPFKWTNNAKDKAGVVCTIIGVRKLSNSKKMIIDNSHKKVVINISPYLIEGGNTIVFQNLKPISKLPPMLTGNSPYDGGNLLLSSEEKDELITHDFNAKRFIRKIHGSYDYLNGEERWCLWIKDEDLSLAKNNDFIRERINKTKEFRIKGGDVARAIADRPHQFRYTHTATESLIIIPRVSSERRKYIPFGFLSSDYIVSDSAQAIYDPEQFVLGVILSLMHMVWVKNTGGYLGTSIRYSSALCYNTFPFPVITQKQTKEIENLVFTILYERQQHSEKTLAQLYDPEKMPAGLREAHHQLDLAVERCYRAKPFETDDERLEYLFKLYEQMIADEKTKGTLFDDETKSKKKKK